MRSTVADRLSVKRHLPQNAKTNGRPTARCRPSLRRSNRRNASRARPWSFAATPEEVQRHVARRAPPSRRLRPSGGSRSDWNPHRVRVERELRYEFKQAATLGLAGVSAGEVVLPKPGE